MESTMHTPEARGGPVFNLELPSSVAHGVRRRVLRWHHWLAAELNAGYWPAAGPDAAITAWRTTRFARHAPPEVPRPRSPHEQRSRSARWNPPAPVANPAVHQHRFSPAAHRSRQPARWQQRPETRAGL